MNIQFVRCQGDCCLIVQNNAFRKIHDFNTAMARQEKTSWSQKLVEGSP